MAFAEKLKGLMDGMELTQAGLSALTGIGRSSVSQYLAGKHEPARQRKREIAIALGAPADYFESFPAAAAAKPVCTAGMPVWLAAKLMGKSREWVMQGLRDGVFPWGYAVKMKRWAYFISAVKFAECTGLEVPVDCPGRDAGAQPGKGMA